MNLFHWKFSSVLILCTVEIVTTLRINKKTTTPLPTTKEYNETEAKNISDLLSDIDTELDLNTNITDEQLVEEEDYDNTTSNSSLISRNPNDIAFYLYQESGESQFGQKIPLNDKRALLASGYQPSRSLIMIIHGFAENYTTTFSQSMKDEYLTAAVKSNIILVDWGKLSCPAGNYMMYPLVLDNIPIAGKRIAKFLQFLMNTGFLSSAQNAHLIGFDVGAHVAGVCGFAILQNFNSSRVTKPTSLGRITGLDPTGPIFMYFSRENKLDSTDATFVDVVHTNQGMHGYMGPIGHADFFANGGGPVQSGCRDFLSINGMCAHRRSYQYFIKSISDKTIIGCQCPTNWDILCKKLCKTSSVFGHFCSNHARGTYYVDVSIPEEIDKPPPTTNATTTKP